MGRSGASAAPRARKAVGVEIRGRRLCVDAKAQANIRDVGRALDCATRCASGAYGDESDAQDSTSDVHEGST